MTAAAPETPATGAPESAAVTPGQALSPDPAGFAYHVRATAFNVLTGKMPGDKWRVPRDERDAIARAVVDAVEPLIRADERDLAARQPQPAPGLPQSAYLYHCKFGGPGGDEYGLFWRKEDADAAAANRAGEGYTEVLGIAVLGDRPEQPAPERDKARGDLALYGEALQEIARRTDGHAPGTTESAVHQVAVSALALNGVPDGPDGDAGGTGTGAESESATGSTGDRRGGPGAGREGT